MKNDNVMVSICCLAYNHEKYIGETLEGFVNQKTNFKYEVIIHDDASTDNTKSIIEEYQIKYPDIIKPIFQVENQYSKGIQISDVYMYPECNGKYICYCEGDDYWCDEYKLQLQFDALESNPSCSICVHKVQSIHEDGSANERIIPEKEYQIEEGILDEDVVCKAFWIRGRYPFHTCSYFVRRSVVDRLIRDRIPTFSYFTGDMNILRASFCEGTFYYINRVMSKWRWLSIGGWNSRQKLLSREKQVAHAKKQLQGEVAFNSYTNRQYEDYIKIALARNIFQWCRYDIRGAREELKKNEIRCDVFDKIEIDDKIKSKAYLVCLMHFSFLLRIVRWLREQKHDNEL